MNRSCFSTLAEHGFFRFRSSCWTGTWALLNVIYALSVDLTQWKHLPHDSFPESAKVGKPVVVRICIDGIRSQAILCTTDDGLILKKSRSLALLLCTRLLGERQVNSDRCRFDVAEGDSITITIEQDPRILLFVRQTSANEEFLDAVSSWTRASIEVESLPGTD